METPMAVEFTLPELGENVEKGDVIRVLVKPGDVVKADQAVLELETDKATIEVPTSVAGTVSEVRVKPGEKISVGQVVLVFDGNGAKPAASARGPREDSESASAGARASGGEAPRATREREAAEGQKTQPNVVDQEPEKPREQDIAARLRRAEDGPLPGRTEPVPEVRPPGASSKPASVVDIAAARQSPAPGR